MEYEEDRMRRPQWSISPVLALSVGALAACAVAASGAAAAAPEPATTGTRTVYLVRHGEYHEDDPRDPTIGRGLDERGREQSRLTGERFTRMAAHVDRLRSSTMTRARETAGIVGTLSGGLVPEPSADLCECTPPTRRADVMARYRSGDVDSCGRRLERAWKEIFRPTSGRDSVEVVVCHGNVIRYFACRAMGVNPDAWLGMATANCAVTAIQIRPDGTPRLLSYGDVGHLPPELQNYADYRWDPGLKPKQP
jgi:serine/threonine-protein phosphatase PGAM5